MNNAKSNSVVLSIVSHGQGGLVFNLLKDIDRLKLLNFNTDKIILTLNIPESENFIEKFPNLPISVIRNSNPKGFGANHNYAFLRSRAEYFFVLNPDVRFTNFNLSDVLDHLRDPKVGIWAPLVYSGKGGVEDSARKFPTFCTLFVRFFLKKRGPDYIFNETPLRVDWVAGMFMAFCGRFFESLGGFDERYFMYMEDTDICYRTNKNGRFVVVDPCFEIIHDAQRKSHKNLSHLIWHIKSAMRFLLCNK